MVGASNHVSQNSASIETYKDKANPPGGSPHDLTQGRLADLTGVSRQTINAMELGKYVPSTLLALKISRVFDNPVNDIFFLEEGD